MKIVQCGYNGDSPAPDLLVQVGPTLAVDIGFDPNWRQNGVPSLPMKGIHALLDTGAAECCVDSSLALQLQLPIIDQKAYGGIGGLHTLNVHLAQIYIPGLEYAIYGAFAGVSLITNGQPHGALIGRNFLRRFRLSYDGSSGNAEIAGPS